MATETTKTADAIGDAVLDTTKAAQDAVKAQGEANAATLTKAIDATAPAAKKVDKATAKSASTVKRATRAAKVKTAPTRRAAVKVVAAVTPAPIRKAAKTVVDAASKVAPPASKEWTLMATQFDTPKMFTDMNDQAKTAVEKSQKLAAEMGDFGKGNIEAMVESSKIAAKGMETMGQDVAEYTRKSFEGMTATLKTMASVKSPTELFKIQSDYARSAFDAAIAQTSKNTEMMVKLTSDAVQPISSRFAVAVEKVKLAA